MADDSSNLCSHDGLFFSVLYGKNYKKAVYRKYITVIIEGQVRRNDCRERKDNRREFE